MALGLSDDLKKESQSAFSKIGFDLNGGAIAGGDMLTVVEVAM